MVYVFDENVVVNGVVFPCNIQTNLKDEDFLKKVAFGWGKWTSGMIHEWLNKGRGWGYFADSTLRKEGCFVGNGRPSNPQGITLVKAGEGVWVVLGYGFENLEKLVCFLNNHDDSEGNGLYWISLFVSGFKKMLGLVLKKLRN
jgi:hypothetical protein